MSDPDEAEEITHRYGVDGYQRAQSRRMLAVRLQTAKEERLMRELDALGRTAVRKKEAVSRRPRPVVQAKK